jgi:hypothetical protein
MRSQPDEIRGVGDVVNGRVITVMEPMSRCAGREIRDDQLMATCGTGKIAHRTRNLCGCASLSGAMIEWPLRVCALSGWVRP